MRVSNEKCKKTAKTKGLSLLKTFGISGFSYVANATTEPLGEVTFLNGRWSNTKSCAVILHSCKGIPHGIVEEASRRCIEMHACKYSYFKRVLGAVANSTDSGGGKSLPSHENIRGKDFYK